MLQNNNRKFLRSLSVTCFRANSHRNFIAIFAIVLTSVLFTSVFTVWHGSLYSIQEYLLWRSGSRTMVSTSEMSPEVIVALIAAIMIILLAGYLILYNVFRISVFQDIRLYGQLKTFGVTYRQISYIVRRQALWLSILGIPVGLLLGWILGNWILPLVMKSFAGGTAYFVAFNWKIMLAAALFTFFTVQFSCRKPARIAGRVSPVEAMKYNGIKESQIAQKKGGQCRNRIAQMAFANMMESKGKTILVFLSIALSITIMNSVLSFTRSFDQKAYEQGSGKSDFTVSSVELDLVDSENYMLPENFLQFIKNQQGIHQMGQIFYHHNPRNAAYDIKKENAIIRMRNGQPYHDQLDLGGKQIYSFDKNALEQCEVVSGQVNWEKFQSGRYVIEVAPLMDDGKDLPKEAFTLQPGDTITADFQERHKTYEVMANVACHFTMLYGDSWGDLSSLVLSQDEFHSLYPGAPRPIKCIFYANKGSFSKVENALSNYETRFQPGISVESKTTVKEEFKNLRQTYNSIGFMFGGIIGVIGLLNLINVILTGAMTRQRQFAVMQSIGMTRKQLRELLVLEGVFYTGIGGAVGIFFSIAASMAIVRPLSESLWFGAYDFAILPACSIAVVYILFACVVSAVISHLWNRESIVDRLRQR